MKPISIYTLNPKLKALGFHEIKLADSSYVAPSYGWLKEFSDYLFRGCPPYYRETFDCENIARWAMVEADKALVDSGTRDAGHTFGEATGVIQVNEKFDNHTLNFCYCDDDEIYVVDAKAGLLAPIAGYNAAWSSCRL
jgi:hypothetical protein